MTMSTLPSSSWRKRKTVTQVVPWIHDLFLGLFTFCIQIFFREMHPRGAWRIPKTGPLIIVAGPHANQFVDSVILMHVLKQFTGRRVSFLIAEKSMNERYIGRMAASFGALPVARVQDNLRARSGRIYLSDPQNNPTLIRGHGTDFYDAQFTKGGTICLPKVDRSDPPTAQILEILGPQDLRLKAAFSLPKRLQTLMTARQGIPEGTTFKVAPRIDQSEVFNTASVHLLQNGCIGIFPEGGSHDRPDLLPLKAGVSIIALNTLAMDENCGLTVIPCGMNYFHPNKFRSRALVEFGSPIPITREQIDAYRAGGLDRRAAVSALLETIHEGLLGVTQVCPDYETLLLVQATRRLYNPLYSKQRLHMAVELNRRLIKGFSQFAHDPVLVNLKTAVQRYNDRLLQLGISDHQVAWGDFENRPRWLALLTLLYRTTKVIVLGLASLPGLLLNWPLFVVTRYISRTKQRAALAGSFVKIKGTDVVATWKMIVAAVLAPTIYLWWTAVATIWLELDRDAASICRGLPYYLHVRIYVPDVVPPSVFALLFFGLLVMLTFATLRVGEVGMDIIQSLPPLALAISPWSSNTLRNLQHDRTMLAKRVSDVIRDLGMDRFDDLDESTCRLSSEKYTSDTTREPEGVNKTDKRHKRKASEGLSLSSLADLSRTGSVYGGSIGYETRQRTTNHASR